MRKLSQEHGFTITEMMVATAVVLVVLSGALTTFKNALAINESASQIADANQNLRAGTNQLIRDVLMAGRIIGTEGIAMPTGAGITYARPGPVGVGNFDMIADGNPTLQMPAISTGYRLGPKIPANCTACFPTDMITIMTVDEFMPTVSTPPTGVSPADEATLSADGSFATFAATSHWIDGDVSHDTVPIKEGDLVLYVGTNGNAIQTVTSINKTLHEIHFDVNIAQYDPFHFNQPNATNQLANTGRPLAALKTLPTASAWPATQPVTLFRALMITYYVDNTTTPGTPRLTRQINNFPAQALAGVVEDLDLTYDLYDGVYNPVAITGFPYTANGIVYSENQIRKVNLHVGVRSERISQPTQDYVRNHITTSVNVRSLAAVDKYPT